MTRTGGGRVALLLAGLVAALAIWALVSFFPSSTKVQACEQAERHVRARFGTGGSAIDIKECTGLGPDPHPSGVGEVWTAVGTFVRPDGIEVRFTVVLFHHADLEGDWQLLDATIPRS